VQTKDGLPLDRGPWAKLVRHLPFKLPEIGVPLATPSAGPWSSLESERDAARERRQVRLAAASLPSYAVTQVTTVAHAGGPAPAREHTGRGLSWGRVLHRLLEAMMRDESLNIGAYAANLLAEEEREPGDLDEAVGLAEAVRRSPLWRRALAAPRRFVEVPFGLMVPTYELGTGGPHGETLLQGALDLVFEENSGWAVVDYKSDAVGANLDELVAFYEPQVGLYRRYWEKLTGKRTKAGLYFIQTGDEVWLPEN
jgi:ATP-dependent helicase/nuclease subunit A